MTLAELVAILRSTGYPVAYSHFVDEQKPPYITYTTPFSPNFMADNKAYHKINEVDIELYTATKDLQVEENLESVLDDNEIPYVGSGTYIESENIYQKIYETRLI